LHELHEYTLLSVIPAKAGIHFMTMSYMSALPKITTRIRDFENEEYRCAFVGTQLIAPVWVRNHSHVFRIHSGNLIIVRHIRWVNFRNVG
jgi:hypothetical protein